MNQNRKKRVKRLVFEEKLDCSGYVFTGIPSEDFDSPLMHALFLGDVNLWKARFVNINLTGIEFQGKVDLFKSSFENVDLSGAKFIEIDFSKSNVENTLFVRSRFKGAYFISSTLRDVSFVDSTFDEVHFLDSYIYDSDFVGSGFGFADFSGSELITADFTDAVFYDKAYFSRASLNSVDFECRFEGELSFSGAEIGIINIDIPSERFKLLEAEIEARRVQRLSYEKEGRRDEADRMFVLEMRAKRRARIQNARNTLERIKASVHNFVEWLLADLPSEYGTNWIRLFLFSLLVIVGNAISYTVWGHYINGFPSNAGYFVRFANALYYSLVTFTTLGYGDMHPTGWLKALSAIEALTGAVFMALIVAVIARKWMR